MPNHSACVSYILVTNTAFRTPTGGGEEAAGRWRLRVAPVGVGCKGEKVWKRLTLLGRALLVGGG